MAEVGVKSITLASLIESDMTLEHIYNPFFQLRVRSLILRFFLICLFLGFGLGLLQVSPINSVKFNPEVTTLILYIFSFGLLCLWTLIVFKDLDINFIHVIGRIPNNYNWLRISGLIIVTLLFSLGSFFVSFYLVSLISPSTVQEILRDNTNLTPEKSAPIFFNLLKIVSITVVAPITEEFIFRGVILQRWAVKWGIRSGLLVSSLLFGVLHANVIGLTVFGLLMGVLYIKTRSLMVAIATHAGNNFLAILMGLLSNQSQTSISYSIEKLHSDWWVGIVLIIISLPFLVQFFSKNLPHKNTQIPYIRNVSQQW